MWYGMMHELRVCAGPSMSAEKLLRAAQTATERVVPQRFRNRPKEICVA
jgi:hypothetical protein